MVHAILLQPNSAHVKLALILLALTTTAYLSPARLLYAKFMIQRRSTLVQCQPVYYGKTCNLQVNPFIYCTQNEILNRFEIHEIVDASQAGEGNLEITISARGRNIPTKVHPQGSARFAVSFVPLEAIDHVITITFNKEAVPGTVKLIRFTML